jgi:M6 family metalloprotease-like protein
MPAFPGLVTQTQADGTTFQARQHGDRIYNWMETENGYPIRRNPETGYFEYLRLSKNGAFEHTDLVVGRDDPEAANLTRHARESKDVVDLKRTITPLMVRRAQDAQIEAFPTEGTIPMLVIMANYNDTTPTATVAEIDALFNGPPGDPEGTGSVSHYYHEVSYGALTIQATVVDWVELPESRVFYGGDLPWYIDPNDVRLPAHAVDAVFAAGVIDFADFDVDEDGIVEPIVVLHTGQGQEESGDPDDIWSHYGEAFYPVDGASSFPGELNLFIWEYMAVPEMQGTTITSIGVLCREIGRGMGLPDLSDTTGYTAGIGDWGLMGTGAWNGIVRPGDSPAHPCAWSKIFLGWITPTIANQMHVIVPRIAAALPPVENEPVAYRIPLGPEITTPTEYLLLENRQLIGYDEALPSSGMLAWHIDDLIPDNDAWYWGHGRVALLQADGQEDLEFLVNTGDPGDPFPGYTDNRTLGPFSNYDLNFYDPNTNIYTPATPDDTGDTNIWVINIDDTEQKMKVDIRFFPNLRIDPGSSIIMDSPRPPVTFRNGTQRDVFTPGDLIEPDLAVLNLDDNFPFAVLCEETAPFWLEYWQSRTGGLTFDYSAGLSQRIDPGIPGNDVRLQSDALALGGVPDGVYTLMVVLDRLQEVRESAEFDNRWPLPGPGMLILRPSSAADLAVYNFSFGPQGLQPGERIDLQGVVYNQGTQGSAPFWIEFWGSFDAPGKDYPTFDFMVCDSIFCGGLPPQGALDFALYPSTLYEIPAHAPGQTFTVFCYADRGDNANEADETNNYRLVGPVTFSASEGMRFANAPAPATPVVAAAPSRNPRRAQIEDLPDLVVTHSTTTLSGQPAPLYLQTVVTVQNASLTTSVPPSWTHVYLSGDEFLSGDDFLWFPGLYVPELLPGQAHTFVLPTGPPEIAWGGYRQLVQCDVVDNAIESDEDNNVFDAGELIVGRDLAFEYVAFQEHLQGTVPSLGVKFSEPGTSITISLRIRNRGIIGFPEYYWLEFWGSRHGGLTLDSFLAESVVMPPMGPLSAVDRAWHKSVLSAPDGPYTFTAVADRLHEVLEVYSNNNREPVAEKRLLELRAPRRANLHLTVFKFSPNPIRPGQMIKFNGSLVNQGAEHTGPFWIEFWGSFDRDMPTLGFPICESILIDNLRPGQQVFLLPYQREMFTNLPTGTFPVLCVLDRTNIVPETDESDNYALAPEVTILP